MSVADDERRRLSKSYRELPASELLGLYEKRETLSATAAEVLRNELRLRGLDPDSLRATVPKATPTEDEGAAGDASLVDADAPEEPSRSVRSAKRAPDAVADEGGEGEPAEPPEGEAPPAAEEAASPAEAAASAAAIRCAHCGTRNPAIEDVCLRCGQPLGDSPAGQTMSRRVVEGGRAKQTPGTIGSATSGVAGISALVFASYTLTLEQRVVAVSAAAAVLGLLALVAAVALYRAEKKRRDSETAPS